MDAHEIIPDLFQGSVPPEGSELAVRGFKLLVLCAEEHQPPAARFPGVRVYYAPFRDSYSMTNREHRIALAAGEEVARAVRRGDKVLVTCHAGLNRSGLVTGIALGRLGVPAHDAISTIQRRRQNALNNASFVRLLQGSSEQI